MVEELSMSLERLRGLHLGGRLEGWQVQLYDYARNRWSDAGEALAAASPAEGVYELAVLRDRRGRTVRVRLVPEGRSPLRMEAASAGDVGLWDALGVRMRAEELAAVRRAVEGREGALGLDELDEALAALERAGGEEGEGAAGARRAVSGALAGARGRDGSRDGGGPP
jgi:hypothetical protein